MKRIALVTGATGGIGGEFIKQLSNLGFEEIWAVGRNEGKLAAFTGNVVPIKADIGTPEGLVVIRTKLESEKPDVAMLVNNAGVAYMGKFSDMSEEQIASLMDVNCKACALLTRIVLPYMKSDAVIFNISSASSFQPNPYLTMYSASKVFVKNFSRALNVELKESGIKAIAVCPGWVDTDMLPREANGKPIKYPGMVTAEKVVTQALKDAKKGKDVSLSSAYNRVIRFNVKHLPTRYVMKVWAKMIKEYME